MSRKRMAKCLALCALALAVCVGIAAALVISKNRQRAAEAAAAAAYCHAFWEDYFGFCCDTYPKPEPVYILYRAA